jgi:Iron dependent repressor, metal binding and dimerisation domain/FeoA domain
VPNSTIQLVDEDSGLSDTNSSSTAYVRIEPRVVRGLMLRVTVSTRFLGGRVLCASGKGGKKRALEIVRHHRLLEAFLYQVLDYPWDEVHDEAERLEHFISERFEARVAAKLNDPEFDPHGHAIPALDGTLPVAHSQTLAQSAANKPVQVASVSDRDPEMLRYLGSQGIKPGVGLKIVEQLPFRGAYRVLVGSSQEPILLSKSLASDIFVNVWASLTGKKPRHAILMVSSRALTASFETKRDAGDKNQFIVQVEAGTSSRTGRRLD